MLWEIFKSDFPSFQETAPSPTHIESTPSAISPTAVSTEILSMPPLRRIWFMNDDSGLLIQIQEDKFVLNWRRSKDSQIYPSYVVVIAEFKKRFQMFLEFVSSQGLGDIELKQYELAYVNHIDQKTGLGSVKDTQILVDHIHADSASRFLPAPDIFSWSSGYRLPDGLGRLYIMSQSAIRSSDGERIVRIDLVARGTPKEHNDRERGRWFDLAHEWITRGFADATSQDLQQKVWERQS
jgi:uncharacterized protein (TIGR04255 family)